MQLPIFTNARINHLSLFPAHLERVFHPGLNMIVGGNGVGKTTFISTLMHVLLGGITFSSQGDQSGKDEGTRLIPKDFFKGRLDPIDSKRAEAELSFVISGITVTIRRKLGSDEIVNLAVSNNCPAAIRNRILNAKGNPAKLSLAYQDLLKFASGVPASDLAFIMRTLLIFDESRRTLLWADEEQNQLLRLMFLPFDVDSHIRQLEYEVTQYTSKGKHLSERRRELSKLVKQLKEVSNVSGVSDPALRKLELQGTLETLSETQASLDEAIAELDVNYGEQLTNLNDLTIRRDIVRQRLSDLQSKFFDEAYDQATPNQLLVLHSLVTDGKCLVCDTHASALKDLGNELKSAGLCVVCRTPLSTPKHESDGQNDDPQDLAEEINRLTLEFDELDSAWSALSTIVNEYEVSLSVKRDERRRSEAQRTQVEEELRALDGNSDPAPDSSLARTLKEIDDLTVQVAQQYRLRDQSSKSLKAKYKDVFGVYQQVNSVLSPTFSEFASKFLGMPCDLVVVQTKGQKPRVTMHPRFDSKERRQATQVSESQRFFLDQAFRMALVTWFLRQGGGPTSYIVETPEGSLDIAYEQNVAEMYLLFASYNHSIILTSNLNSSRFLRGVYNGLESDTDRQKRTLNLIAVARLSDVQRAVYNTEAFNSVLAELGLPSLPERK